jgi:hypothetical protein
MFKRALFMTVSILLVNTTSASIGIDLVEVDNSANPILDGYRTFDLIITTDTQWTTSALYLELDQGSVYQDTLGPGFYAPSQALLDLLEQNGTPNGLAFDTYYNPLDLGQGNAATDVGAPWQTYPADTEGISRSWGTPQYGFDQAGLSSSGTQLAARITLSDDAVGSWSFGATEVGTPQAKFINNPINVGQMSYVPLQGDLTHDGFVGIEDLNNILSHWNMAADPGGENDPSGDGFTGIDDLNTVLGNWNAGTARRPILATPKTWGDLDTDGFVGINDLKVPNNRWGLEVTPGDADDPSGDGFVGIDDLSIVISTWNFGTPPSVAVPEPATIVALGLGCTAMLTRSRGRV